MIETINTNDSRQSDAGRRISPFAGWEWLRIPALLIQTVGMLGLISAYAETTTGWTALLRLPGMWSSVVIIVGGAILLAISAAAYKVRFSQPLQAANRKSWRSL